MGYMRNPCDNCETGKIPGECAKCPTYKQALEDSGVSPWNA